MNNGRDDRFLLVVVLFAYALCVFAWATVVIGDVRVEVKSPRATAGVTI